MCDAMLAATIDALRVASAGSGEMDAALERVALLLRGKRRPAVDAKHTGAPNDAELQHSLTLLATAGRNSMARVSDAPLASLLACLRSTDAGAVQAVLKSVSYLAGGRGRRVGAALQVPSHRTAQSARSAAGLAPCAGLRATCPMRAAPHPVCL
jgi:hypothetical protein